MSDYFSEYSSFVGTKGLPSPADTPYETPGFLRSKRSSRATTAGSTRSREQSATPPPLPPDATDYADKSREGRYSALDPRRFTPTLHASLVSEILTLRRELDSKNNLVENLETSLATAKTDNETLSQELTTNSKEVRNARQQMAQMESGAYEALETMVKERDSANASLQELKSRLEVTQKKTRGQDEDAERTQSIWEREKEQWDNERRQLERRVHVTEMRLRSFVEEMTNQQAAIEEMPTPAEELDEQTMFKDSGIGNDSDTISVLSHTGKRHTRNVSSLSFRNGFRNSIMSRALDTPEPFAKPGYSLADELDIDEEDEYDMDDSEHGEEEMEYHDRPKHRLDSRQGSVAGDMDSKAKRILGLSGDMPVSPSMREFPKDVHDDIPVSPTMRDFPRDLREDEVSSRADADHMESKAKRVLGLSGDMPVSPSMREFPRGLLEPVAPSGRRLSVPNVTSTVTKVQYVDSGYQPSPPSSPPHKHKPQPLQVPNPPRATPTPTVRIDSGDTYLQQLPMRHPVSVAAKALVSPISPPETPVDGATWPDSAKISASIHKYASTSTQTDAIAPLLVKNEAPARASLQVPVPVPQIAIHPPTSRPSSPRPYVLPPGTKNAGSQVSIPWPGKDASMQTEEIRIDQRPVKLPAHLLPSHLDKLPHQPASPKRFAAPIIPHRKKISKRETARRPNISTDLPMLSSFPSPPMRSPTEATSPSHSRDGSVRDLGKMPLKAIPLPIPTLAPPISMDEVASEKPKGPLNRSAQFGVSNQDRRSRQLAEIDDPSDESDSQDSEAGDQARSMPVLNSAGRFEGPDPSQFIPDDLPNSPQRRPTTADSYDAAPAPSISSSRNNSYRGAGGKRPPPSRSSTYLKTHTRNESFGSMASSNFSTQSSLPPHAIPTRSSSRFPPHTYSEGAQSPTPDGATTRGNRQIRGGHQRQGSLRKVQSAVSMRGRTAKISPQKPRRRRRSPNLTPVQSMAFESPAPTKFPIPELPTPLQQSLAFDWGNRNSSPGQRPSTATSSVPPAEETQLIDSIAGTMVGEWMWKYMRKRKSFGVDAAESFTGRNGDESSSALTSHGTRHKRWVWLSPYERTIMWDSKQPTSGTALLGKKGRKLAIRSVIDVADETPLPKRPELSAAFDRSILILTPSRALKFTAINAERHALWMNALSFLAESDRAQLPQLPSVPPIPDQYQKSGGTRRQRSPSFGRSNLRDSVNLAKGRQPNLLRSVSAQNASSADVNDIAHAEPEDQGADFPCIPRLYSNTNRHQRKRSNTTSVSPRLAPPFSGLRSFSSTAIPSTSSSSGRFIGMASGRPNAPTVTTTSSQSDSRRPSEVNGLNSPDQFNFFDAMGTSGVRMQAFVDPAIKNGVLYVPPPPMPSAPPPSVPQQQSPRRRGRGSTNFSNGSSDKRRAGYVFDDDGTDPFKGF